MSTRDFEDGMVAGAKPFETKFSQQASDIRKIRKDMEKWCDRYGSLVDVVLDDLGDQEKQRIYRIQTKLDPANMGESEQELLVCILYTVARHTEATDTERNRLRQKFLHGVENYLGITRTIPIAIYFEWMNGNDGVAWFWTAIVIGFSFIVFLFINLWSNRTTKYRKGAEQ